MCCAAENDFSTLELQCDNSDLGSSRLWNVNREESLSQRVLEIVVSNEFDPVELPKNQ